MSAAPDPLAPFRTQGARPASTAPRPPSRYQAYAAASGAVKPARLDIRPKSGMAVARLYSGITEIAYEQGSDCTGILLVLPGKMIKVRGCRLRPIIDSLLAGTCEFLAELRDDERPDDNAPVIEHIQLMTPQAKD